LLSPDVKNLRLKCTKFDSWSGSFRTQGTHMHTKRVTRTI